MNQQNDDVIEALLRKQFDGPVPDDGFCDQVMQRLPLRRHRSFWPLAAGILTGMGACWLAMPPLHIDWRQWMHGELSASILIVLLTTMGMSLLAAWWAVSEADDR